MFENQAASRHVFDLKVFLLFSWLSSIRFFSGLAAPGLASLPSQLQHNIPRALFSLMISSQLRPSSMLRARAIPSHQYIQRLSEVFKANYVKRFRCKISLLFHSCIVQVINYWTIKGTRPRTESGLAQSSISGIHASRGHSSRRSGTLTYTQQCIQQINFDKN